MDVVLAVQDLWELAPLLVTMLVLVVFSAFFSASEAALFSLRASERSQLKSGTPAQRRAHQLLEESDRLLSAVLFWNLVINIAYFATASLAGLRLRDRPDGGTKLFAAFTAGSLLVIIFCSEMLPKTFAVLKAPVISAWVSIPMSVALRIVDPLLSGFRVINLLSRRLIWPTFRAEPYLQVSDLERAIEVSTNNAHLIDMERAVLRNLMSLSDLRVDECMRPRSQLKMLRPPIRWEQIEDGDVAGEILCVTEPDTDEIVSVLNVHGFYELPSDHLERFSERVLYAPWSARAADVLQMMEAEHHKAAAIVNEMGETVGVVLRSDILEIVFSTRSSRSERLLNREPILPSGPGEWLATGMTNLRTIEKHFDATLPETSSVTIAGVIQECLQRLPDVGDQCQWGPFSLEVLEIPENEPMSVRLRRTRIEEDDA